MKLNTKLWRKLSILKGVGVYRSERLEWNSTLFFAIENEINVKETVCVYVIYVNFFALGFDLFLG